jgi:hypothetical protein
LLLGIEPTLFDKVVLGCYTRFGVFGIVSACGAAGRQFESRHLLLNKQQIDMFLVGSHG